MISLKEPLLKLLRTPIASSRARSLFVCLLDMSHRSLRGFSHSGLLATLFQRFLKARCASVFWCLVFLFLSCATLGIAEERAAFWIAPRTNTIIDEQTAAEIGLRSGIVVLRAARGDAGSNYSFPEIVDRIKNKAPNVPVLAYAWISRYPDRGRIEADLYRGLDIRIPLAEVVNEHNGRVAYLDVTDPKVRSVVVKRLAAERDQLGVDGFAVDVAHRTPVARPKPLSKICEQKSGFCEAYAKGMDEIMQTLNLALGEKGTLVYNGLWNFEPGMLQDQAKLLACADMAAIEYFGMDPNLPRHNFSDDVLPYLQTIGGLPAGKSVLVFGRGPWNYTDYQTDYHWQRYLFASYLLAKRGKDLFKYHSSFQVPAHAGRAGGLDVYADWNVDLGTPLGPYRIEGGLYQREFTGGQVIVAPDDGVGGRVPIVGTKYSLEGEKVTGRVSLTPGEGLILLNNRAGAYQKPVAHIITAQAMASWGWSNTELKKSPGGDYLSLGPVRESMVGEHDMLLDYERSLTPYRQLEIKARLPGPDSSMVAVAEVDDPRRKNAWVEVAIGAGQYLGGVGQLREAVDFRTSPKRNDQAMWSTVAVQFVPDAEGKMVLDGEKLMSSAGYRFRRWAHLRFNGAVEVSSVALGGPIRIH